MNKLSLNFILNEFRTLLTINTVNQVYTASLKAGI